MARSAVRAAAGRAARREGRGSQSRERILAAALSSFAERGFDGTTTRRIAAQADVNLGLIQYYFGGKLELWRAAVDRAFEELHAALAELLAEDDAMQDDERMRLLVRGFVRFVAARPEFVHMMHDEGRRLSPRMRWLVDRHVRPIYETLGSLIRSAQARGVLPAGTDPLHFHYILVGAMVLIFHQAAECQRLTGLDPADPAVVEAHADAIEALLLRNPSREEPR